MKADNKVIMPEDNWTEKQVERYFCRKMEELGCQTYKFISPGCAGVPDRIVILPGGEVWFVELKRKRGELSAVQDLMLGKLEELTNLTQVLYGKEDVDLFFRFIKKCMDTYRSEFETLRLTKRKLRISALMSMVGEQKK